MLDNNNNNICTNNGINESMVVSSLYDVIVCTNTIDVIATEIDDANNRLDLLHEPLTEVEFFSIIDRIDKTVERMVYIMLPLTSIHCARMSELNTKYDIFRKKVLNCQCKFIKLERRNKEEEKVSHILLKRRNSVDIDLG